jgi:carbon monoxide dehydrogenase subunit G
VVTRVEKTIEVNVPVRAAYNQWTQFEQFPQFMGGVQQVQQLSSSMLHWVAEIAGVKREWDAAILEQVPDQKVAWAATSGATNAGAVFFTPAGGDRTMVRLSLEYEPEGLVEKIGDFLSIVEKRAQADLEKFKQFIESRGVETGGWRGQVNEAGTVGTPGVDDAAASRGDSGKAGVSATAAAAGIAAGAAVAGVAATTVAAKKSGDAESKSWTEPGVSGDVVAVGPASDSETTGRLEGDPVAVDESATTAGLHAGVAGDTTSVGESGTTPTAERPKHRRTVDEDDLGSG